MYMMVSEALINAIREAARFNPDIQVAPACILWPDRDRQWEAVIPRLQAEAPELMVLGDYTPEQMTGPAIWLRCVLAGQVGGMLLPPHLTPILYLPGVSRQDLRAVDACPDHLKPLAELQYRGVIWSQINAKDWTVLAFLKSNQGGLGLDVATDNESKNSLHLSLHRLIDEDIDHLRGKHLDRDFFNTLLTSGDPVRDVLRWLEEGEQLRSTLTEEEWTGFVEICKSQLAFDPDQDGVLTGYTRLARHEGPWKAVWDRYCEAPQLYPSIPDKIRTCQAPSSDLFSNAETMGGWPQWNDERERELGRDLSTLSELPPHEVRARIKRLEQSHGERRSLVWADLGMAPLAGALGYLATVADRTTSSLAGGSVDDLRRGYQNGGWRVDDAVMRAMAEVSGSEDVKSVATAVRAMYLPWLQDSARYFQKVLHGSPYPGGTVEDGQVREFEPGDCVLFVDGLRFDAGKRLVQLVQNKGLEVTEEPHWAALPSVTATGKPAVAPIKDKICGHEGNADFQPSVAATGQPVNIYHLRKLIAQAGWVTLDTSTVADGEGLAWCEFGDIDKEGHDRGWKLSKTIEGLLSEVRDRVVELLAAGWKRVFVVTDHGWLLMPGGLPKTELSTDLTQNKWGRCASIKQGATVDERLFPWYWNPSQYFALADGVSCFKKGDEYTHGGVSLQECLTLHLMVTRGRSDSGVASISDVAWHGLRCTIEVKGTPEGLTADIRLNAGDSSSSAIVSLKAVKDNGTASMVVENEDLQGAAATVVLLDANGHLVTQMATVIGGGSG